MGLLTGKTVVVTGVLTDQSIAFHIARLAQEEGADVILTSFGRTMSLTRRSATRLPTDPPIVELDVTNDDDLAQFADRLGEHCETVDGLVHSIGFAPE
ncbi:MAG: SDR family oxidoreductase, partial [Actinomycetota bacterium]|nr:SDR family oxidoreductase [Actinomycetota bacterium]